MSLLKTSTSHAHFVETFGDDLALVKIKECGFDGVDFGFHQYQLDYEFILLQDDDTIRKYCKKIKDQADSLGLDIAHTHAPYYFCDYHHYTTPVFVERFINAVKATAYLGSKHIVIHPAILPDAENTFFECIDINKQFYSMLKPYANDLGVTVAIENMCGVHPVRRIGVPSASSSAEKLSYLIDQLGEGFCACLDTGHAFFCGQEPAHFARLLGKRLQVIHMQDNDGSDDMHVAPTFGKINWGEFTDALAEIGYNGYLNTEVNFLRSGKATVVENGKFLDAVSRDFARKIQEKRSAL